MERGGRRTPPNNRSLIVTRSRSDPNVILDPTTMLETTPDIPANPVTPVPQGIDVQ
jgi:hypothetical protein